MRCPKCDGITGVIDSRPREDYVSRRRECERCGHRFTTRETPVPSDEASAGGEVRLYVGGVRVY